MKVPICQFVRSLCGLVTLASLCASVSSPAGTMTTQPLDLSKVYEFPVPKSRKARLLANLDPESRYLYVAETGKRGLRVQKIDWTAPAVVKEKQYSETDCTSDYFAELEFVPGTKYIHLRGCGAHYLVDSETLSIVRNVASASRSGESVVFSPDGKLAYVSEYDEEQRRMRAAIYGVEPWSKISEWNFPGTSPRFTPDGLYLATEVSESGDWKGVKTTVKKTLRCGLAFHDVKSGGKEISWMAEPEKTGCPRPTYRFVPGTQYLMVDEILGRGLVVRDGLSGRVLYDLPSDLPPSTGPEVSPDGRLVVAGAWDDPQDQEWSRDFVIWSLQSRQIVYQMPRYRSVRGRNTHGREAYPRFSSDGRYLIVAKELGVELYRVLPPLPTPN